MITTYHNPFWDFLKWIPAVTMVVSIQSHGHPWRVDGWISGIPNSRYPHDFSDSSISGKTRHMTSLQHPIKHVRYVYHNPSSSLGNLHGTNFHPRWKPSSAPWLPPGSSPSDSRGRTRSSQLHGVSDTIAAEAPRWVQPEVAVTWFTTVSVSSLPFGRLHNYGKSLFFMGEHPIKLYIVIFDGLNYQRAVESIAP